MKFQIFYLCLVVGIIAVIAEDENENESAVDYCESETGNPCKNGGQCSSDPQNEKYTCTCTDPYDGNTCEDLTCKECRRFDDLVIILFQEPVNGEEAKERCEAKGYELHMPKTKKIYDFTTTYLKGKHAANPEEKIAYFIGLEGTKEKSTRSEDYRWFDEVKHLNSSSFTNWAPGRPTGQGRCVEIPITSGFKWGWDDERCLGYEGWTYYYICEKKINPSDQ